MCIILPQSTVNLMFHVINRMDSECLDLLPNDNVATTVINNRYYHKSVKFTKVNTKMHRRYKHTHTRIKRILPLESTKFNTTSINNLKNNSINV